MKKITKNINLYRNIRIDLLNMSSMSGTNLPQPIPLERSPQPIKLERSHQSLTGTTAVPGPSVPSSSHVKIYNSYRIQSTGAHTKLLISSEGGKVSGTP